MKTCPYLFFLFLAACNTVPEEMTTTDLPQMTSPTLVVLGTVQDAGSPHAGCQKDCCKDLWSNPPQDRKVVSLGLIDPGTKQTWLFEATPDISAQMEMLSENTPFEHSVAPDGIFLTHAHIGHYTGLMYLGKEALNTQQLPVYVMSRMDSFLRNNGPWDQLVSLGNIRLMPLKEDSAMLVTSSIRVIPFRVPHRDEYSETVGYRIEGPTSKILFIPDIDKWNRWEPNIIEEIAKVDIAFLDATFFANGEIQGRDMSGIPHPFVEESMALFDRLPQEEKQKIRFIHFNHTNPLLDSNSSAAKQVRMKGYRVAKYGEVIPL